MHDIGKKDKMHKCEKYKWLTIEQTCAIRHLGLQTSKMLYGKSTFTTSRWWRSGEVNFLLRDINDNHHRPFGKPEFQSTSDNDIH